MKGIVSKSLFVLLLGLLGPVLGAAASPTREFTKSVYREFSTTANGTVSIYNRYGKVNVNTWTNNTVKIDITIIVNTDDQRAADRAFERIQVNFANTYGYVKAETVIMDNKSNWLPGQDVRDFKINYNVWIPVGNQLDLKNRYGDSYVAALDGKLTAEIKYGNLRTESVNNDADLYLGYGDAYIDRVNNLYGQVSYGNLTLPKGRSIQLDTKYSHFKFEQSGAIRITSRNDEFDFGVLDDLRLQTKYSTLRVENARSTLVTAQYTDMRINNLQDKLDADMTYGNVDVKALGKNFSEVRIIGNYTDVKIGVNQVGALRFDFEGSYCDFQYPSNSTLRHQSRSNTRNQTVGFVGDSNARGVIFGRFTYGALKLK